VEARRRHRGSQAAEKGERIHVDRDGAVGEGLLERDTHEPVGSPRDALLRDGGMASLAGLASAFADRLRAAPDKQAAIDAIASEMDGLVYTATGAPLEQEEKLEIVDMIDDEFYVSGSGLGGVGILNESDNRKVREFVNALKERIEG